MAKPLSVALFFVVAVFFFEFFVGFFIIFCLRSLRFFACILLLNGMLSLLTLFYGVCMSVTSIAWGRLLTLA